MLSSHQSFIVAQFTITFCKKIGRGRCQAWLLLIQFYELFKADNASLVAIETTASEAFGK